MLSISSGQGKVVKRGLIQAPNEQETAFLVRAAAGSGNAGNSLTLSLPVTCPSGLLPNQADRRQLPSRIPRRRDEAPSLGYRAIPYQLGSGH